MTIYEYFNRLTSQGLGIDMTEEFDNAVVDTLELIRESSLADIESGGDDEKKIKYTAAKENLGYCSME